MKEVKGLGDRLYGLEQLMYKSKKYVSEQSILAQTFVQVSSECGRHPFIMILLID